MSDAPADLEICDAGAVPAMLARAYDDIKAVKSLYLAGAVDATALIDKLDDLGREICDLSHLAHCEIYSYVKLCDDPASPPGGKLCLNCPNLSMALDGYPMCRLSSMGLEL